VLIGFEKDPGLPTYPTLETLGGVVLNERKTISADRAPLRRWIMLCILRALLGFGRASRSTLGSAARAIGASR
jgi:hypothetical protein